MPSMSVATSTTAGLLEANAWGYELEPGVNTAGVIEYPTADDQYLQHLIATTVEIFDLTAPEGAFSNLRYGLQIGAFQALADVFWITEPEKKFDHGVLRLKLRLLRFEPQRTSIAIGGLARFVDSNEGERRIEDKRFSLLGVVTTELFPFRDWGGFLVNAYLDNRVFVGGLKVQLYHSIKAVAEMDWFHSSDIPDRELGKAGIEIEGETSFYLQVYWAERSDYFFVQIGGGF